MENIREMVKQCIGMTVMFKGKTMTVHSLSASEDMVFLMDDSKCAYPVHITNISDVLTKGLTAEEVA